MSVLTYKPPTVSRTQEGRPPAGGRGLPKAALAAAASFCFVLALAVCLVQNLSRSSVDQSWSFDSSHYLNSAQQLFMLWQHLREHGTQGFSTDLLKPLAEDILLDGPILPLLGSFVLLWTGKALTFAHAPLFIGLQSFFGACSAALLCLTGARFTGSWRWGALAGTLWALYPPAVIAAGKFLTEIPSALMLICLVLVLSLTVEPHRQSLVARIGLPLLAGVTTTAIWLLKAALAPTTVLIEMIAVAQVGTIKDRALFSSALLVGLVTALLPWLVFTKAVSGHMQVMPQRVPVLNAVYGLEADTDGWGSVAPKTPFQLTFFEGDGLVPTCFALISAHPNDSLNLIVRKTTRMWEAPSNDYHRKFLRLFTPSAQGWWHDALMLGGLFGLLLFLCSVAGRQVSAPVAGSIGLAGAATIAAHLIFAFFSTNTRYGFTAMPFFILFAVYALARVFEMRVFRQAVWALCCGGALMVSLRSGLVPVLAAGTTNPVSILVIELSAYTLLLTLAILFTAATAKALQQDHVLSAAGKAILGIAWLGFLLPIVANQVSDRTIREWATALRPGEAACRRISLPQPKHGSRTPDWAYVVFDGNEKSSTARVRINGSQIEEQPEPIYASNRQGAVGDFQSIFAKLLRAKENTLRQWRVVAVPVSALRAGRPNTIALEPAGGNVFTLYGDYPNWTKSPTVPSLTYFSPTKLCNATAPLDARAACKLDRPLANDVCWLRNNSGDNRDLSTASGNQFGRYRLLLLTGFARTKDGQPDLCAPGNRIW